MILKPQDVVVLLKLVALGTRPWTFQSLAMELSISQSEVHAGVRRAVAARLMTNATTAAGRPVRAALLEFLVHGVKYAYPPERGQITGGVPTGYAARPLSKVIAGSSDPPPVWPYFEGTMRGYSFAPLYRTVPQAALRDSQLYELLALVDAVRDGRAREADLAAKELESRLSGDDAVTRVTLQPAEARPTLHSPAATYASRGSKSVSDKLHLSQPGLKALCRKYGIAKLSLFGSASRGELTPQSDVDLMVEFSPDSRASLFDITAMQDEFSAALGGRKVDIATPEILRNPFRRDSIVPDLKLIYEA
jgi:predicted nucleotidyltransferase